MLRCAFARSVVRWLMKPSSLENVVKRNTLYVDVVELSTVCIVANSLSLQDKNNEVNLLVAEIVPLDVQLSHCNLPVKSVLGQGEDAEYL